MKLAAGHTSDGTGGLYLVVRHAAMLATEGHYDNFAEKWNGCEKETRGALLVKVFRFLRNG